MLRATLVLYFLFNFGYVFTRGQYNPRLFWILAFSLVFLSILFFAKKAKVFFANLDINSLVLFIFIFNALLYVLLYGGIYFQPGFPKTALEYFLPLVIVLSFIFTIDTPNFRKRVFPLSFALLVCIALVSRFLLILASSAPRIDTFDLFKLGPKYLIEGKNPYSQSYPQLYRGVTADYYSYSPLTLYLFLPADILFNDPRYTYLVSDLVVVFLLYKILSKAKNLSSRTKYLLPLLFLYHPSESIILEQSWMDPLIFMMLVLFVYFERCSKELKKFSFIPLAFFLGMRHTMLIISPVFFLFKKIARKTVFLSLGAIFLAFLPFALWNFGDFWDDLVKFYVTYPVRHDSITLNSFIFFTFGKDLPKTLMNILGLLPLALVLIKRPDNWHKLLLAIALLLFALSFFNKLAFVNHYFFISLLILFASIIGLVDEKSSFAE